MSKHTKTPWVIDDQGDEILIVSTHDANGLDDDIASIKVYGGNGADRERALADARLFVAAPDMLAALNALLSDMEACGIINFYDQHREIGIYGAVSMARAAAAKAHGEGSAND